MKIVDYISKMIQTYPSLFKDVDYEKSKMKVLENTFFTVGNGLEIANTKNKEEGGYIVEPKFKFINDENIRTYDKPYGKEKYKKLTKNYFNSYVYYLQDEPNEVIYKKNKFNNDLYLVYVNEKKSIKLIEATNFIHFKPYPFDRKYALIAQIYNKNIYLQPDWMTELILLCERTKKFYEDENQYINDYNYPNEEHRENQLTFLNNFLKKYKK